jgi:hypothetical protein
MLVVATLEAVVETAASVAAATAPQASPHPCCQCFRHSQQRKKKKTRMTKE